MPSLAGQVILITGGTSGLGAESAMALARRRPARIYISGRRAQAAEAVMERIQNMDPTTTEIHFLRCDLADMASVSAAAGQILAAESRLDVVLANAGVAAVPAARTPDGYEVQFATNHLGHALLVRKLLPLLRTSRGRIVTLASYGYRGAKAGIPFDSVKVEGKQGGPEKEWLVGAGIARWRRYAESKLANVVYARELARRYPDLVSVSVAPGFVATSMVGNMGVCDRWAMWATASLYRLTTRGRGVVSAEEGAQNQVWAAAAGRNMLSNGGLYAPVGVLVPDEGLSPSARDDKLGQKLWDWTEGEIKGYL
ncbi:hypothetical protein B0H63DRAFT_395559 [Podospora didyma]|uniref:Oxidoreductase n=1 Tax=Podospora didyma TaxID=330526 RepID=A0AAE0NNS5_9PEZI|nr:hypothetical protein B0H63DRAFT_395559 [Podospora didyma]